MSIMFKVCKRTIERKNYPEDMQTRVNVFHKATLISDEEFATLMSMLSK